MEKIGIKYEYNLPRTGKQRLRAGLRSIDQYLVKSLVPKRPKSDSLNANKMSSAGRQNIDKASREAVWENEGGSLTNGPFVSSKPHRSPKI